MHEAIGDKIGFIAWEIPRPASKTAGSRDDVLSGHLRHGVIPKRPAFSPAGPRDLPAQPFPTETRRFPPRQRFPNPASKQLEASLWKTLSSR